MLTAGGREQGGFAVRVEQSSGNTFRAFDIPHKLRGGVLSRDLRT